MDSPASAKVQHVTKKSSDELLRKFAELGSDSGDESPAKKELKMVSKRRKRSSRTKRENDQHCESPSNIGGGLGERRALLPLPPAARRKSALLGRRSQQRARDMRNKSLLGAIEKAWRKTIEGASKVFMEKHYNRHKRLINDVV